MDAIRKLSVARFPRQAGLIHILAILALMAALFAAVPRAQAAGPMAPHGVARGPAACARGKRHARCGGRPRCDADST